MNKIYRVFFDTDLRNGHLGLAKIASDAKIKILTLAPGNFVCFINRAQTSISYLPQVMSLPTTEAQDALI